MSRHIPTDDDLDLGGLPRRWQLLELMYQKMLQSEHPADDRLTARRFDEAQTAGHRVYTGAYSHIQAAMEHADALFALLRHHGATPRAPWSLLRPVFESAFWAVWVLEPGDGLERRRRALKREVLDYGERVKFYDTFLRHDPTERDRIRVQHLETEQTYRREADELGLGWKGARERIALTVELDKSLILQSLERELQGPTAAMWRSLSGMQHGFAWALMLNSDRRDETPILGGQRAVVTIKDSSFVTSTEGAFMFLAQAMSLYTRRCTDHRS